MRWRLWWVALGPMFAWATPDPAVLEKLGWQSEHAPGSACGGFFVAPRLPTERVDTQITQDHVHALANQELILSGHVLAEFPEHRLMSDEVVLRRGSSNPSQITVSSAGEIQWHTHDMRLVAANAELVLEPLDFGATDVWYSYPAWHAWGQAHRFQLSMEGAQLLQDVSYSTCSPARRHWQLHAKTLEIHPDNARGVAHSATLHVMDVPVAYLPYWSFPVSSEPQSGFLVPSFASSSDGGRSLSMPYYWRLSNSHDLTITPNLHSKRGMLWDVESRYLGVHSRGQMDVSFIGHDAVFEHYREAVLSHPPASFDIDDVRLRRLESAEHTRGALRWQHHVQIQPHWRAQWDIQRVSDDDYLLDFSHGAFVTSDERQLASQASVEWSTAHWHGEGSVLSFQTLQPASGDVLAEPYQRLPQVRAQLYPMSWGGVGQMAFYAEYDHFFKDKDPRTGLRATTGDRLHLAPQWSLFWRRPYALVTPRLGFWLNTYRLDRSASERLAGLAEHESLWLPHVSVDGKLDLLRYGEGQNWQLSPRLYYLYVPFRDQDDIPTFDSTRMNFSFHQLFRNNRFSGADRLGDANQLSYAVTLDAKIHEQHWQLYTGQSVYLRDRKVRECLPDATQFCVPVAHSSDTHNHSPWVLGAHWQPHATFNAYLEWQWDPRYAQTQKVLGTWHYQPDPDHLVHVSYRFDQGANPIAGLPVGSSDNDLIQADAAWVWRLGASWRLITYYAYDMNNRLHLDRYVGVSYEGCCVAAHLGARRYLAANDSVMSEPDYRDGFYLQLVLKGLMGIGSDHQSWLEHVIPGYRDRADTV